jgi:hypothetical protein
MKIRNQVRVFLLFCVVCSPLASLQAIAEDNIERSCKAKYGLYIIDTVNARGSAGIKIDSHTLLDQKYEFSARRGCGRTVPNRCRYRASEAAIQCMATHANAPATKPAACTSDGVENYSITNLEKPVQEAACRVARESLGPDRYRQLAPLRVKTSVKAFVDGDKGCGGGDSKFVMKYVGTIIVTCTNQD